MSSRLVIVKVGSALVLLVVASIAVATAAAEQTGRGGVAVSFDATISPRELPRHDPAPVFLHLRGGVRSTDGSPPPDLARIELAFGARGGLDTAGLPVCPRARLRNATAAQALSRCRGALVGRGGIIAEVPLDPDDPLIARAGVLAFNGRSGGRPAVWLHAYSAAPPVAFVLPFYLRRLPAGAYGLLIRSPVRRALGSWPRLRSFEITLGRRYRAGGELHSYLNGRCPLPPSFSVLSVPVARAAYHFASSQTVTQPILRRCRVR